MSFEEQILDLLHNDASISHEQLATMLGRTAEEVSDAVAKMEKSGLIMGYGAIINTERMESDSVSALIEVRVSPQRDLGFDAIAKMIYSFPEVKSCYLMSGAFDLMVIVEGKSIKDVANFVAERLSVQDNVLSCATHFILKRYKQDGHQFVSPESDRRQAVTP